MKNFPNSMKKKKIIDKKIIFFQLVHSFQMRIDRNMNRNLLTQSTFIIAIRILFKLNLTLKEIFKRLCSKNQSP